MVKLKIICPWSPGGVSSKSKLPPPMRRSSSLNTQQQSNLARYFSIAFFIFAATTYLVFSLDMLMVPEEEAVTMMPRRRMDQDEANVDKDDSWQSVMAADLKPVSLKGFGAKLRTIPSDVGSADHFAPVSSDLLVLAEEDLEALNSEKQHVENDARIQGKAIASNNRKDSFAEEPDDDFALGLNSIGLAMQSHNSNNIQSDTSVDGATAAPATASLQSSQQTEGDEEMEEPPQPEEEEEDEEEDLLGAVKFRSGQTGTGGGDVGRISVGGPVIIPSSEWRRMHTCKYGRSEKSSTLAYGTWVWRHKRGAVLHDEYTKTPSDSKLRHLKSALRMLLSEDKVPDIKQVISTASEAGYTLCKIDFDESMVVAWQPRLRGDALFFTRHLGGSSLAALVPNLVVEVPHALYDHTLYQGLHVFSETKAKALILSESHRCSRSLPNKCTGNEGEPIRNLCSSSSSSSSKSYHNSDAAHAVQTTFHAVHELLADELPLDALFASLHATKSEEFIISDGTSNMVGETAPVVALVKQLAESLPQNIVSLCNEHDRSLAGSLENLVPVTEEKRLVCGATNVQGRHLNGAQDACRAKVHRNGQELKASGRFIHIEQPVNLVLPVDSKTTKPVMSKQLSEALLVALSARRQQQPLAAVISMGGDTAESSD